MRVFLRSCVALCVLSLAVGCGGDKFKEFSPPGGGYSVLMPGTPKGTTHSEQGVLTRLYTLENMHGAFFTGFTSFPKSQAVETFTEELRNEIFTAGRNEAMRRGNATLISETDITLEGGYFGREVYMQSGERKDLQIRNRMYLSERGLYQVAVVGKEWFLDSASSEKFFNSFRINSSGGAPNSAPRTPSGSTASPDLASRRAASAVPGPRTSPATNPAAIFDQGVGNVRPLPDDYGHSAFASKEFVIRKFNTQGQQFGQVMISQDGTRVLTVRFDPREPPLIKIWDESSPEVHSTYTGHTSSPHLLGFSPDGRHVLSSDSRGGIHIWDLETHEVTCKFSESAKAGVFSHDGLRVASPESINEIAIWNAQTGEQLGTVGGSPPLPTALGVSEDGTTMVALGHAQFTVWNKDAGALPNRRSYPNEIRPNKQLISTNGRIALLGMIDNVYVLNLSDESMNALISDLDDVHKTHVDAMSLSTDGKLAVLMTSRFDPELLRDHKLIRIFDLEHGEEIGSLRNHATIVQIRPDVYYRKHVDISKDGKRVVSLDADGGLRLWNVPDTLADERSRLTKNVGTRRPPVKSGN